MKREIKLKEIGKNGWIYILAITLIYLIVSLINFANLTFDLTKLNDWNFWTTYSITIGLALLIMILSISYQKKKTKTLTKITDEEEMVYACARTLSSNGNYKRTIELVALENRRRKLVKYKKYLQIKRNQSKNDEEKQHYIALINDIDEVYLDKQILEATNEKDKRNFIKLKNDIPNKIDGVRIKYQEVKINSLFNTYYNNNCDELETKFNGTEGLAQYTIPSIIIGLIIVMIIMTAVPALLETATLDIIIQLVTRLGVMTTYLIKGLEFSEYSITTVYFSILKNRKSLMIDFIHYKHKRNRSSRKGVTVCQV
jgi:hypothetical protein